ncbi:MAG: hypothetical protein ABSA51_02605 [Anaerolineaceae bacterium]|jgi:hypothetical protein
MAANFSFVPGLELQAPIPLDRYIPPVLAGSGSAWLKEYANLGEWVIEPLCSNPMLALEAARAGYRVLVTCNNPILDLLLRVLAKAPTRNDFQAALAELASVKRGDERLEVHLKSLYSSRCPVCGESIQVDAYLWQRGQARPDRRVLRCPNCKAEGEYPIINEDMERLATLGNPGLYRSRAVERVIHGTGEPPDVVKEALEVYQDRPLYFLTTLVNRIEGLPTTPERKELLHALAVSVCDLGSTLWPWGEGRSRPRQLSVSPQFKEHNLWQALEDAIDVWTGQPSPIPLTNWPEQPPPSGGIALYRGRLRNLFPLPEEVQPKAIIAALPYPNQAFWTLSAIWSGWLWGKEGVQPMKSALGRQHYDLFWAAEAFQSTFTPFKHLPDVPCFFQIPELATGFLLAVMTAAQTAGLRLDGFALREREDSAQMIWRVSHDQPAVIGRGVKSCRDVMRIFLAEQGEPATYLRLLSVGLQELERMNALRPAPQISMMDKIIQTQASLKEIFDDHNFLKVYGSAAPDSHGGWWLAQPVAARQSLSDRVELEILTLLQQDPVSSLTAVDRQLCERFTGLMTPSISLIQACLESYTDPLPNQPDQCRLRPQDMAESRRADLTNAKLRLAQIGHQLGFRVETEPWILWRQENDEALYWFGVMATSAISEVLFDPALPSAVHHVIVLPGGRASLLSFKLRHDPRLAENTESWHFLKFRHLRQLAERSDLTAGLWTSLLDGDPPRWEGATQIQMF